MFSNIKTSKVNRERVTYLTNKLNLGAENVIARLAFSYSIGNDRLLELGDMQDSGGKEYSSKVLFGDFTDYYVAMVCVSYQIYKTDKDVARYVKMHIDDGLEMISSDIEKKHGITGTDFMINEIEKGLALLGG